MPVTKGATEERITEPSLNVIALSDKGKFETVEYDKIIESRLINLYAILSNQLANKDYIEDQNKVGVYEINVPAALK